MSRPAFKRRSNEYKLLKENPSNEFTARPLNEDNLLVWEVTITGPEGSCYEGGVFPAQLIFWEEYPFVPPKMYFTCEMFHPSVHPDGRVCMSILGITGNYCWSSALTIDKICLSVASLLADPDPQGIGNIDAGIMWRDNREEFYAIAKSLSRKSRGSQS